MSADDPFRGVCRISRERFADFLRAHATAPVVEERDPGEYWDAIRGYDLDPLFILAIFAHESGMGRAGVAVTTKSWGNTRFPSFGATPVSATAGRSGIFPVYATWLDGCVSTAARLAEPTYVYAARTRIGDIFDHPSGLVWAPAGDANDPDAYLASVLRFMAEHADQAAPQVPVRVAHIPAGNANRPGTIIAPRYVTVHETANEAPGANAEAHRRYTHEAMGGPELTSYNYVVDSNEIVELLPVGEASHHSGTAEGNRSGVAIELCVNADGDWERTLAHAKALIIYLWATVPTLLPPSQGLVPHQHWRATSCPARLFATGRWDSFVAEVAGAVAPAGPGGRVRLFPETGQHLGHGFLSYWEWLGDDVALRVLGYPLTEEFEAIDPSAPSGTRVVQVFERAVLEYHPEAPPGWTVQQRQLGRDFLTALLSRRA